MPFVTKNKSNFLQFTKLNWGKFCYVTMLCLMVIAGCKPSSQTVQAPKPVERQLHVPTGTKSGLVYEYFRLGDGETIANGDEVTLHYIGKLDNGKKFDNSYERGRPLTVKVGQGNVISGWDSGLKLFRKGDRVMLRIPPDLAYGDRNLGDIPPNSTLIFEMDILDVKKKGIYYMDNLKGRDTLKTASGLKYIKIKEGKGTNIAAGQMAKVHYDGVLLNTKKFDSSYDKGEPFMFTVGKGEVIKAWDEILPLMNKGTKYRLIVPPTLGYGEKGLPPDIPANATLVFDLELLGF